MNDASKSIFLSKTFVGLAMLVVGGLCQRFHFALQIDENGMAALIDDLITAIGLVVTIWGRLTATQPVHIIPPGTGAGTGQGGFVQLRVLLMAFIASLCIGIALAGCVSVKPQTTGQVIWEMEGEFATALGVMNVYSSRPPCDAPAAPVLCADIAVVQKMYAAAKGAYAALLLADGMVRAPSTGASQADAAIGAARAALTALLTLTSQYATQ